MTAAVPAQPSRRRAWLLATRPATLTASVTPVLVGTAAAGRGHFRLAPFAAALIAALLIQIGTNLANDYFDFRKGADTAERLGPMRVTQSGLLAPETVRTATALVFGLAALVGLYLVSVGGLPILLIGLAAIAAGVLYTGGPWPLGYHGLGDLAVFLCFGMMAVAGTTYLYTAELTGRTLAAAVPVGMTVTAILVVNNLRDIDTDRAARKYTLAVLIGRRATQVEYILLLAGAYLVPLALRLTGATGNWFWLPWLTLPLAAPLVRTICTQRGRALNPALKGTARLHLLIGALFAAALLLG
ncbi:MAG TPA: 1,4-dihydroxy-2-naphthoate polyprenyltransferase [Dehalococcoidia bacterium]|jgi:1,4-dihydroxy-2-naphthoate octaprenyltransferase|nr:1,4-dihydroxy-2-naphthoate polyprenyltransferase [Dehalococcoidia bacterium]